VIDNSFVGHENFDKVNSELKKVSDTFCLAKWTQSTLHLHQGRTHSCHHPPTHIIPIENIAAEPHKLHNTDEKIEQRRLMLSGKKPSGCDYCWRIEEKKEKDSYSDRILKSSYLESWPYANQVINSGLGQSFNPKYLEISFSNICQFKCSYCSADYSSKWQAENQMLGPFSAGNGQQTSPIIKEEENEYIKAFWNWWPNLKKDLKILRITGGEPLLSPNTLKILDELSKFPEPDLILGINSNLGVNAETFDQFLKKAKTLSNTKSIKYFNIYTSIDTFGAQAEYIRNGLNLDLFKKNIETILSEMPQARIVFMVTFNILSPYSFLDFLDYFENLKSRYLNSERPFRLGIDINYLRYPEMLSLPVAAGSSENICETIAQRIESHPQGSSGESIDLGYTYSEIEKARALRSWSKTRYETSKTEYLQKQFIQFIKEHDQRRNTDFNSAFSGIQSFFSQKDV
jgi:organic radical activating enzyme